MTIDLLDEALLEVRHDGYDPGYDVEVREDLDGRHGEDRDINGLAAIDAAIRSGMPVVGWRPASRNPGEDERVLRATRRFEQAALRLVADAEAGRIAPEAFRQALAAAFMRQARNAFIAGKRALGNLAPLTRADEADLLRVVSRAGLDDDAPPETFANVLTGLLRRPGADHEALNGTIERYVATLIDRVTRRGFEATAARLDRELDADAEQARQARATAEAMMQAARASGEMDIERYVRLVDAAIRRQRRVGARQQAQRALVSQNRALLIEAIRAARQRAMSRMARRLDVLLGKVLDGRMDVRAATEELLAILHGEARRGYIGGRRLAGLSSRQPLSGGEEDEVEDEEAETVEIVLPERPRGVLSGLVALGAYFGDILADPIRAKALYDPGGYLADRPVKWLNGRIAGIGRHFYGASKMGEKAAFRRGGEPVPPLERPEVRPAREWTERPDVPLHEPTPMGSIIIVWWRLGDAQRHCADCVTLSEMSPYVLDDFEAIGLHPGSGHTECQAYCRCFLEYDVPDTLCADEVAVTAPGVIDMASLALPSADCGETITVDSLIVPPDLGIPTERAFDAVTDMADDIRVGPTIRDGLDILPPRTRWLGSQVAQQELERGERGYLAAGVPIEVTRLSLDDATYDAISQETGGAIRLVHGSLASGPEVLEPELTIAALRLAASNAALRGLDLELDPRLVNPGMARFLDEMGARRVPSGLRLTSLLATLLATLLSPRPVRREGRRGFSAAFGLSQPAVRMADAQHLRTSARSMTFAADPGETSRTVTLTYRPHDGYTYVQGFEWRAVQAPSLRRELSLAALSRMTGDLRLSWAFVQDARLAEIVTAVGGRPRGRWWEMDAEATQTLHRALAEDDLPRPDPLIMAARVPHAPRIAAPPEPPERSVVPGLARRYDIDPDVVYALIVGREHERVGLGETVWMTAVPGLGATTWRVTPLGNIEVVSVWQDGTLTEVPPAVVLAFIDDAAQAIRRPPGAVPLDTLGDIHIPERAWQEMPRSARRMLRDAGASQDEGIGWWTLPQGKALALADRWADQTSRYVPDVAEQPV